jgi:hypothetical protein
VSNHRGGFLAQKVETTRSIRGHVELAEKNHPKLSMRKQCKLLGSTCSVLSYKAVPERAEKTRIKPLRDEIHMLDPCLGSRRLVTMLESDQGVRINLKRLHDWHPHAVHDTLTPTVVYQIKLESPQKKTKSDKSEAA